MYAVILICRLKEGKVNVTDTMKQIMTVLQTKCFYEAISTSTMGSVEIMIMGLVIRQHHYSTTQAKGTWK